MDTRCLSFGRGSDAVLDAVLITRDKRGANYIQYTLLVHINRKRDSDDGRATTGVRGKGVSKPWEEQKLCVADLGEAAHRKRSAMSVFVFLGWWGLMAPDLWSKGGVKVVKVED